MLPFRDMSDRFRQWQEDAAQLLVRKNQVTTVRYKVYLFFLGLFLFMFEPLLTWLVEEVRWEGAFSFSFSNPIGIFSEIWEWWLINSLDTIEKSIKEAEDERIVVKSEKELIVLISDEEKQNTLIKCLNMKECEDINDVIMKEIKFLRVFMMMNYLGWEKMAFDQKVLLRSINEFLNRSTWWLTNWSIQWIEFQTPRTLSEEYEIKSLDIVINMEFDHKKNLISFLENLEDKVFKELPVLYVINNINYDIVNYTERQAVNIVTTVYYFDGQPPEVEQALEDQNKGDAQQQEQIVW